MDKRQGRSSEFLPCLLFVILSQTIYLIKKGEIATNFKGVPSVCRKMGGLS